MATPGMTENILPVPRTLFKDPFGFSIDIGRSGQVNTLPVNLLYIFIFKVMLLYYEIHQPVRLKGKHYICVWVTFSYKIISVTFYAIIAQICMYVCMYVCMYAYMHAGMFVCMYVCMFIPCSVVILLLIGQWVLEPFTLCRFNIERQQSILALYNHFNWYYHLFLPCQIRW